MNITPPIIIIEGLDVGIFQSIEQAEAFLEPWWVRQSEGVIYDMLGQRLQAKIVTSKEPLLFSFLGHVTREKIKILVDVDITYAPNELRVALVNHLYAIGDLEPLEDELHNVSIDFLLDRIVKFTKQKK